MKAPAALFVLAGATFLVSCTSSLPPLISWAHFSSPMTQSFTLTTNTAVLYGRFGEKPDFTGGNKIGLRLRNESGNKDYLIRLRQKDPVYGIAVEPGLYRVEGFVATFTEGRTADVQSFRGTVPFDVPANSVTYVGDYEGYVKERFAARSWGLSAASNNFAVTTEEFRKIYTNLVSVPAVSAYDQQTK
jgi:hypothetical protein